MNTLRHTASVDFDEIRDGLAGAAYAPIDCFDLGGKAQATAEYFELRGWEAIRFNTDSLSFATFSDDGLKLMTTTLSGVILSEASFSSDRIGARAFLTVAELRP
jgi:hypothetical protein